MMGREYLKEYYAEKILETQPYYHGTSTALGIKEILPPCLSGVKREDFRHYNDDLIYITSSFDSARRYAIKAALQFGGLPVVYKVIPDDSIAFRINNEYTAKSADIVDTYIIGREIK